MVRRSKRTKRILFIEFLVVGVLVGLLEDILAIMFATDAEITPQVVLIALVVAVPFAFISEIIVDHPKFWEAFIPPRDKKK